MYPQTFISFLLCHLKRTSRPKKLIRFCLFWMLPVCDNEIKLCLNTKSDPQHSPNKRCTVILQFINKHHSTLLLFTCMHPFFQSPFEWCKKLEFSDKLNICGLYEMLNCLPFGRASPEMLWILCVVHCSFSFIDVFLFHLFKLFERKNCSKNTKQII